MRRSSLAFALLFPVAVLLGGCDMLGIESAEKIAASREADGKAIGSACRHAGRAIEDCFAIYKKADRAAVFAGWRDMNDYMRENKIDVVAPQLLAQLALAKAAEAKAAADAKAAAEAKPPEAKASDASDGSADKRAPAKPKARDAKAGGA